MCGICGEVRWGGASGEVVEKMTSRMYHRGPDGGGVVVVGGVALGHRRLAILDLADAASQPMVDPSGRYWIVFNGEIYNYRAIREDLQRRGEVFNTTGDTEVLLRAYITFGEGCLAMLNGMFAFAIWDSVEEVLFLARDRMGEKPLLYCEHSDHSITFASELKALFESDRIKPEISPIGLRHFLSLGYNLTAQTIVDEVKNLPPGCCAVLKRGGRLQVRPYWDLAAAFGTKSRLTEAAAIQTFLELFDDSVSVRLVSDVPVGAFLSGGIDSSSIVASMVSLGGPFNVKTFTIGFNEEGFNEAECAEQVARYLKIDHHVSMASAIERELDLNKLAYFADAPFADTSTIPMLILAKFAREFVTVALSGDGGDELFLGYETYVADKLYWHARKVPARFRLGLLRAYQGLVSRDFGKVSFDYKIQQFLQGVKYPFAQAHYSWRELFSTEDLFRLLRPHFRDLIFEQHPVKVFESFDAQVSSAHFLDRASYVDMKTWLVDDILVKADRTTMAHSLESRSPFMDHRLVEFAAALPISLKLNRLKKKYILRRSQNQRLQSSTVDRKKAGFNAPLAQWMLQDPLKSKLNALVEGPIVNMYCNPDEVRNLVNNHLERRTDNSFKLFSLLCLEAWNNSVLHQQPITLAKANVGNV